MPEEQKDNQGTANNYGADAPEKIEVKMNSSSVSPETESDPKLPVGQEDTLPKTDNVSIPVRSESSESNHLTPPTPAPTLADPQMAAPFVVEPATQPAASSFPVNQGPVPPPKRRMSKKLLAGIVAGVVAVVLIGGGAAAYTWYQNPQKTLNDAMVAFLTAKNYTADGNVNYTPKDTTDSSAVNVSYKVKGTKYSGSVDMNLKTKIEKRDIDVSAALTYSDKSDVYFKLSGFKDVLNLYTESTGEQLPPEVNSLIQKIDGKWYVFTNQDLKDLSPESAKVQTCVTTVMHEVDKDNTLLREVGEAYAKNQFIIIKKELGVKEGNVGYRLGSDNTTAKEFGKALKDTKLYKKLTDCSPEASNALSDTSDVTSAESSDTSTVELWINQWSHQPAKLVVNDDSSSGSFVSETKFVLNNGATVTAPTGAASYKELQKDVEALTSAAYSSMQSQASASSVRMYVSEISSYVESYSANNRGSYPTYDQLISMIKMDSTSDAGKYITSQTPTAASATMVQYQNCSIRGSVIRYFDTATNTVKTEELGEGCKSV